MQVLLALLALPAAAAAAAPSSAPTVSFAIIGDWGARARDRHAQRAVAEQLQAYHRVSGARFTPSVSSSYKPSPRVIHACKHTCQAHL